MPAKLPITSNSLPEEKVLLRDQVLEVRSMDGRIRAGPEGTPSEHCVIEQKPPLPFKIVVEN